MKVSEIGLKEIKDYLRITENDEDTFIQTIILASKAFIRSYTGLNENQIDNKEDLAIVLYVLCSEMYDNRQYTADKDKVNIIVKTILDMHSINLL